MSPRSDLTPGRFRWRLILVFLLVAGIAGGIVAGGSYYLVHRDRYASFLERSLSTAGLAASLAEVVELGSGSVPDLLERLDRRGRFDAVVVTSEEVTSNNPTIDADAIPDLTEREEGTRYARTEVGGEEFLVVSPTGPTTDMRLYLFFPTDRIDEELARLRNALLQSLAFVVVLAGLVGHLVARQTLRPVARASRAARLLAEGLLETRLPIERKDEFGAWAASFNEMAQALQDKIEALTEARERERRFTSDVAHELRTPLTALVTATTMLRKELSTMTADARWAAERALAQVTRLRDLVEEILEMSRLDSGQSVVDRQDVDLERFLTALVRDRHWTSQVEIESQVRVVSADPRRLERILSNLIDNALCHGGGRAWVKADKEALRVVIDVVDHGSGIDEIHLDHLFDRFYKGDPSRMGGTGLGLAIARENARLMGGDIFVTSESGEGTRFSVVLPARAGDVVLDEGLPWESYAG